MDLTNLFQLAEEDAKEVLSKKGYPWRLLLLWNELIWCQFDKLDKEELEQVSVFKTAFTARQFGDTKSYFLFFRSGKVIKQVVYFLISEADPQEAMNFMKNLPLSFQAFFKFVLEVLEQKCKSDIRKLELYQQESREIIFQMMKIAGIEVKHL